MRDPSRNATLEGPTTYGGRARTALPQPGPWKPTRETIPETATRRSQSKILGCGTRWDKAGRMRDKPFRRCFRHQVLACGCCGSCVAPPRARPPPRRIARFRSLRHKLAAWLDGTPQTGASVADGPRRGSPASPFPWSGCGPHRVGQSSCRVAVCARESASRLSRKIPGSKLLIAVIGGACRL